MLVREPVAPLLDLLDVRHVADRGEHDELAELLEMPTDERRDLVDRRVGVASCVVAQLQSARHRRVPHLDEQRVTLRDGVLLLAALVQPGEVLDRDVERCLERLADEEADKGGQHAAPLDPLVDVERLLVDVRLRLEHRRREFQARPREVAAGPVRVGELVDRVLRRVSSRHAGLARVARHVQVDETREHAQRRKAGALAPAVTIGRRYHCLPDEELEQLVAREQVPHAARVAAGGVLPAHAQDRERLCLGVGELVAERRPTRVTLLRADLDHLVPLYGALFCSQRVDRAGRRRPTAWRAGGTPQPLELGDPDVLGRLRVRGRRGGLGDRVDDVDHRAEPLLRELVIAVGAELLLRLSRRPRSELPRRRRRGGARRCPDAPLERGAAGRRCVRRRRRGEGRRRRWRSAAPRLRALSYSHLEMGNRRLVRG